MAEQTDSPTVLSDNYLNTNTLDTSGRNRRYVPTSTGTPTEPIWFVLRDLRRANAKVSAYSQLLEAGQSVFTPLHTKIVSTPRGKERREVPVIPDLLFVRGVKKELDPVVESIPTLQYRYQRGAGYQTPMTVDRRSMDRFIAAVTAAAPSRYYTPGEITPDMYGRAVRIIGGPLDGHEGRLLKLKGLRKRHLLIDLPNYLTAAIEVAPEFIQLLP